MNDWLFVVAAYALAILGTLAVTLGSLAAMRRAEGEADALRQKP